MTKKDFNALAKVIREELERCSSPVAEGIASHCATRNDLFSRSRFLDACRGN